jgi:hypothetical protein
MGFGDIGSPIRLQNKKSTGSAGLRIIDGVTDPFCAMEGDSVNSYITSEGFTSFFLGGDGTEGYKFKVDHYDEINDRVLFDVDFEVAGEIYQMWVEVGDSSHTTIDDVDLDIEVHLKDYTESTPILQTAVVTVKPR